MTVTINGQTGITAPGLDSATMPNVGSAPVVESGSNTDGEWVRWADGTQHCSLFNTISVGTPNAYKTLYLGSFTWNYPLPFKSLSSVNSFIALGNQAGWTSLDSASLSNAVFYVLDPGNLAPISSNVYRFATGRWEVPV